MLDDQSEAKGDDVVSSEHCNHRELGLQLPCNVPVGRLTDEPYRYSPSAQNVRGADSHRQSVSEKKNFHSLNLPLADAP